MFFFFCFLRNQPGICATEMSDQEISPDCNNQNPFMYNTQANGSDYQARNRNIADQEDSSPFKPTYQRKRKQPAEVKMGKVGSFSPVVSNMRKTQSVHDLVNEGKRPNKNVLRITCSF